MPVLSSPGVIVNERDESFLQRGVGPIGPVLIGETEKGPAFNPTKISNFSEYRAKFGNYHDDAYLPYAASSILVNTDQLTVVRVLGLSGYTDKGTLLIQSGNLSTTKYPVYAVIKPTFSASSDSSAAWNATITGSTSSSLRQFNLWVSSSIMGIANYESMSLLSTDPNYICNVLGTDPRGTTAAYVDAIYNWKINSDITAGVSTLATTSGSNSSASATSSNLSDYTSQYRNSYTPAIQSQKYGTGSGVKQYNLFKLHTLSDGNSSNQYVKTEIRDIKPSPDSASYGTFTVVVRNYSDSNSRPEYWETFPNTTLDPDSPNYIVRMIGDKYSQYNSDSNTLTYNGDFDNISNYVRVEMYDLAGVPKDALPFGFSAYLIPSGNFPSFSYATGFEINSQHSSRQIPGVDFDNVTGIEYVFQALHDNASTTGSMSNFYLGNCAASSGGGATYTGSIDLTTNTPLSYRKFLIGFYNGFDGTEKVKKQYDYGTDGKLKCTTISADGTTAFKRALNVIANEEVFEFDLITIPGLNYQNHSAVFSYASDIIEGRGNDCMLLMDPVDLSITNEQTVIDNVSGIDNSYFASFWPWIKVLNPDKNKYVWKPASVEVIGAFKFNDKVAFPWFAPAGLNRGLLTRVREAKVKLTATQRDTLYTGRVNPLATYSTEGVAVWGNKNHQVRESLLNRINVRRLLISCKRLTIAASRYFVFEQNDSQTRSFYTNAINPILEEIRRQRGLNEFRFICDDTNNTPDLIDQNIMYAQVWLKPTTSAERIILDLNVSKTGVSFSDL